MDENTNRGDRSLRVADYVASFMVKHGITDIFSVVGGGSMYLNDAFAHTEGLSVIYNHHEQASSMAAESYYKACGKLPLVCVTSGPGGTNTVTGLLGAYQDSIPMFIVSGQVRYETTVESTGLELRQFGSQEHQIVDTVKNVTKFAVMISDPTSIRFYLEKALYIAMSGRRGPVWIDVPLDIQNTHINPKELNGYIPDVIDEKCDEEIRQILEELSTCERPLLIAGSAIRTVGYSDVFVELVHGLHIPVVYPLNVPDAISSRDEYAMGCFGGVASRAANIAVQNSDLLIVFGCRMAFTHIGFNYSAFSPQSKKITIDIDEAEQAKPTMKRDIRITKDVGSVIDALMPHVNEVDYSRYKTWREYCSFLKRRFPIYQKHHNHSIQNKVNPYYIAKRIMEGLRPKGIICLGNSSGLDPLLQMGIREMGQRIILNCNCGSMGYCLPAGIGAYTATKQSVLVYTGDGCIQMNLQELETIVYNNMDIKIIVLNNGGYGGVVSTQKHFFKGRICGANAESGIGMPDFEKLAMAYGLQYCRISNHKDVGMMDKILIDQGPALVEVIQDTAQEIEPHVASRQDENGQLVSTALDDMAPFLPEEEYYSYKYVNWKKRDKKE